MYIILTTLTVLVIFVYRKLSFYSFDGVVVFEELVLDFYNSKYFMVKYEKVNAYLVAYGYKSISEFSKTDQKRIMEIVQISYTEKINEVLEDLCLNTSDIEILFTIQYKFLPTFCSPLLITLMGNNKWEQFYILSKRVRCFYDVFRCNSGKKNKKMLDTLCNYIVSSKNLEDYPDYVIYFLNST